MEVRVCVMLWLGMLIVGFIVPIGCKSLYDTHSVIAMRLYRMNLMKAKEIDYKISCDASFTDAMQLCALLDIVEEDIRRCYMGVSRSIRLQRLDAIHNLTKAVLDSDGDELTELPIDGTNFRVSYAYGYDSIAKAKDESPTSICVVGQISLQFLIALTSLQSQSTITIYIPETTFYDYFLVSLFNDFIGKETRNHAKIVSADLLDRSAEHAPQYERCDVVHIRDTRVLSATDFSRVVSRLAGINGGAQRARPVTLVWERRLPAQCVRCLMRRDNCVDSSHPAGYARLANVSISKFCYDEFAFRTSLMQGGMAPVEGLAESPGGEGNISGRVLWEYSGRSDAFELYKLTQYLNGRYGQIMFRNQNDSVDVFAGLLYAQQLEVHPGATKQAHSSPVVLLKSKAEPPQDEDDRAGRLGASQSTVHEVTVTGASVEALLVQRASSTPMHADSGAVLDKDELVIFITYSNRVFDDTAYGVQEVLRRVGYRQTCVMGEWDQTMYRALRAGVPHRNCAVFNTPGYSEEFSGVHYAAPQASSRILLQIVLGPHEPTVLAPHYIAFQMEHPWSTFFADPGDYPRIFADAAHVWCFADNHKQHMVRELGFRAEDITVVPIYTRTLTLPDATGAEFRKTAAEAKLVVQAVDVLFTGSHSDYRERIVNELYPQCVADTVTCMFICQKWTLLPFGEERHLGLAHTTVVLNIHAQEGSSLEVHRVNHLLSLGKCVVSERSTVDPAVDLAYQDAVVFADNTTHMYQLARYYVTNVTARREVEQAAVRKFHEIQSDTAAIENSMQRVHSMLR